ncbi:hypothetical protein [Lelliottia nimipressuralis]
MDELAKKVQEKYIEDLTNKYPLHRFLILFIVIFFMLTYQTGNADIYNILDETNVKEVFDFQGGLLSKLSMLQLIQCLLISCFLNYSHKKINISMFNWLISFCDFNKYTSGIHGKYISLKRNDAYDLFLVKEIDKKISEKKSQFRIVLINSELVFSFLFCVLWSFHGSFVNIILVFSLLILWAYIQWACYKFYITDFFPLYVAKKYLLDEPIIIADGFHD